MLRILCVGTCLAYFIATVSTAIPFKPYTSSGYGGFEDGFEGAVDYSPVRYHRFSLQQGEPLQKTGPDKRSSPYYSLISDAVRDADYQKDTFYFKPLDANTNLENGERKAAMDNTERVQYIDGRKIEAVRSVDNRPSSWWKTYLNRNKGGPIRNFFSSDDAMVDVEEATSPTKPFSSEVNHNKDYLIKTNNPYFNLIISKHTLAPSIAGKSSTIVKLPPEVNPEGKHWITDENVALIRDISRNDVNSASNDANRHRDSNGAQRKRNEESHSDKHFIQDDVIKFPEKDIISSVYNMIESANSFPKWDDDVSMSLDDAEVLPEAQRRYVDINNKNIFPKPEIGKWDLQSIHFTTVSVGTLMIFLILVVMVLALRVHCRNREKTAQEWIRHPVVQPATAASDAIQPNLKHILHPDHLHTEPIRIKAKGLLERRGSNTSLTIDLGSGSERADGLFSPSRECTPEDFLMTAGSRMSRRQLRNCLKDPRDLHAEFWQIPTNHPDKCGVPGAAAKNRYRTVLPNEDTRVVLHKAPPDSPESPASQYINANYIRGYEGEERAYVATQGPLAHTIEDMWLLVLQERSPAIVMITRLKEKGRVKCEPYIPSYAATYGSVHLTVKQVIQKNGYTIRQIYLKRGDEVHTTLHFWFTSWPDHKAPSSARHLLAMASEVETARMECRGPVVVHCSAGIGRTGCFIGVSIGRLQLLEEDCVDVLSIVCQMRLDRGGMVQTAEQYEFIHRALALYEASLPMTASAE